MSRYDDYESTQTSGTYTYFPFNGTQDPNNTIDTLPDVTIESIDAAASSLQLGTDILETQVVEIGSADVTTTIYGPMNIIHAINASSLTLDYDLIVGGNTLLHNLSAAELTSTRVDTGIVNATSLNVNGTTTLGTLYAGNCSLMNVSAAKVDLNTLTVSGNCSLSNVSASRLDANTLTANNVSTANLNVGNILTSNPISSAYTIVSDVVGSQISLSTFTSVTPNGSASQTGNFYTYTSTYSPGYNIIQGKLNLTPVFAQTTYRVCLSVNAANNSVNLSFQDDASTLYTIGTLDTTPRKKYVFYLKPTVTGRLYLTISRMALSGSAAIEYDFLSVDAWYETNLSSLNATGSTLLASGGGQVGVGTTTPQYTLDVSGTMRVTGETILENFTINKLATPLTPIYAYPVTAEGQIGYVYPTITGTPGTISITINTDTQLLSRSVPAGVFLVSAYYRTYTTTTPTYSSISVGPSVGSQHDSSSVITNSSITPTSFITCFLNYSSEGTIYSSALVGASGSISRPTCILKVARVA